MIRILLIRHGSNDLLGRVLYGRMPGISLNAPGLEQAELLAKALQRHYQVTTVISSPLERAVETAAPIASITGAPLKIDEGLTEVDYGEWIGKSFAELGELEHWHAFNRFRSIRWPPGGESMMQVQARAWQSIERAVVEHRSGSTIAMVTHGDVIRSALVLLLGMPLDHIHRLEIAPTSTSEIVIEGHAPVVKRINQIFY